MRRVVLILALAAFASPTSAHPQAELPQCPIVVENTTLKTDCIGPMIIAASNVAVNLATHQVICGSPAPPEGIRVDFHSNVRIYNGHVHKCHIAIGAYGNSNQYTDLHIDGNTQGIFVQGNYNHLSANYIADAQIGVLLQGDGNRVEAGMVFERNGTGVAVFGTDNTVTSSRFLSNTNGYWDQSGGNNSILSSFVSGSRNHGILVTSDNATVQANEITGTALQAGAGIRLVLAEGGEVIANNVRDNASAGIFLTATSGTRIAHNRATRNLTGIHVSAGATNNYIVANTALDNFLFDLEDDNPNCDANIWRNNNNRTQNQPCIE